jgi:hypothetical protein
MNGRTRDERTERQVAFHEAGHAFAAILARVRFDHVTTVPEPGKSDGHCAVGPIRWNMFREVDRHLPLYRRPFVENTTGKIQAHNRMIGIALGGMAGEIVGRSSGARGGLAWPSGAGVDERHSGLSNGRVYKHSDIATAIKTSRALGDLAVVPATWKPKWISPSGHHPEIPDHIWRYLLLLLDGLVGAFLMRLRELVSLAEALEARKRLTWREAVSIAKGAA